MTQVGFIGAGGVANVHKVGLQGIHDVEVVALVKKEYSTARHRADELGIPRVYAHYQELLADPDIEVVHCLVPNHLHYAVIKEAIEAGKHVMAEKPLTVEVEEAEELVELAEKTDRICGVNFRYRYFPALLDIRQQCLTGEVGDVRLIHGMYLQDWLSFESDYNWRLDSQICGNLGTFTDIGSHWFDLVEYLSGQKIIRVCARLATFLPNRIGPEQKPIHVHVDDSATVLFELGNGGIGTMLVSQVAPGRGMSHLSFEMNGSKQSVAWNREQPHEVWIGSREKPNYTIHYPQTYPSLWNRGVCHLMENFYGAIKAHKKGEALPRHNDYPTLHDGLRSMRVSAAILKSYVSSSWVDIE